MSNPYEANIHRSGNATACYNGLCTWSWWISLIMQDPTLRPEAEKALKEIEF